MPKHTIQATTKKTCPWNSLTSYEETWITTSSFQQEVWVNSDVKRKFNFLPLQELVTLTFLSFKELHWNSNWENAAWNWASHTRLSWAIEVWRTCYCKQTQTESEGKIGHGESIPCALHSKSGECVKRVRRITVLQKSFTGTPSFDAENSRATAFSPDAVRLLSEHLD